MCVALKANHNIITIAPGRRCWAATNACIDIVAYVHNLKKKVIQQLLVLEQKQITSRISRNRSSTH